MWPWRKKTNILVLGGSGETLAIAALLKGSKSLVWWTGARPEGASVPIFEHHPPFTSQDAFEANLQSEKFACILDATHGFDPIYSDLAAKACAAVGVPYVYLRKPAWRPDPRDTWIDVPNMQLARAAVQPYQRVFTNIGRGLLHELRGAPGQFFVRQTVPHSNPPLIDNASYVFGTPPFSVAQERALFTELTIDAVLFRNTGGDASVSKVKAAQELGLPLVMLQRPKSPDGIRLSSMDEVKEWIQQI